MPVAFKISSRYKFKLFWVFTVSKLSPKQKFSTVQSKKNPKTGSREGTQKLRNEK